MSRYIKPLLITLLVFGIFYMAVWPAMTAHAADIKMQLIHFKKYCIANPWTGYTLYAGFLCTILFAGLPVATSAMLLAGVLYGFWEAATLVTFCRLLTASVAFFIARQMIDMPTRRQQRRAPYIIRKFERHPNVGLVLARLAPIPDSVVNYTLAASPIGHRDYVVCSLVGMIPFTLLCVWLGQQVGTVSSLMRFIH